MPTELKSIALDGLDGAGKGTVAEQLGLKLPGNTLIVDYPNYETPWGKVLTHLLKENDEGLSLKDRMLVYALNRLETIDAIKHQIEVQEIQSIVFDRFWTSNVITAAYYFVKLEEEQRPSDLHDWLGKLCKFMLGIDSMFLDELSLRQTRIYVPMLDEKDSLAALHKDITRTGADSYESLDVQSVARQFYGIVAGIFPDQIRLFSQYEGERRMTPTEQAQYILGQEQINPTTAGIVTNFVWGENIANSQRLASLLQRFGSPDLQRLNAYN